MRGVTGATYARASDVLWRLAHDRVLVRRIGHDGRDLVGLAAMIWLALDEPRTLHDLEEQLGDVVDEPIDIAGTLDPLARAGLIDVVESPART